MDFDETMRWCAAHNVKFSILDLQGQFLLHGKCGRIESEYPFDSAENISPAMWTVGYALKTGTEFHELNGFIPHTRPK